jgi:hypothetical protein
MAIADGYRWADHLVEEGYARKSVRNVWIAALSATAGFMVERRKLAQKPLLRIKVRDVVELKAETATQPRQEGFTVRRRRRSDRDRRNAVAPDLGRDARRQARAAVALLLFRRPRQRAHVFLPARRHAGSGEQGLVHGHQAVARKDLAAADGADPQPRHREGFLFLASLLEHETRTKIRIIWDFRSKSPKLSPRLLDKHWSKPLAVAL